MPLSSLAVQNAKPRESFYLLTDGNGLHLLVNPNGSKLWRLRYRFGGKQNMLGLGSFPEITLADARGKRDDARKLLANGVDPSRQKKLDKITAKSAANNTFGAIAEEHLKNQEESGTAASTMVKNRWYLQDLAAPVSNLPITQITPAEILSLLKKIEKSGRRETARKVRGAIGSVFRLAITTLSDGLSPPRGLFSWREPSWKDYRLETFEEIVKEGRKFGVFVCIASQRPNDISATITSQAHNYFNGPYGETAREFGNQGTPDMGNAGPFRGELGEATEGAIRTAAIIRWPGHVKPETTSYAMFSIMDFLPTFSHIVSGKMPTDRPIDGVDQTDVLFGNSTMGHRESLLSFIGADLVAARWKQWRIYFIVTIGALR